MLTSLIKSAMVVVEAPVAVVADVVTIGGALSDRGKSYTAETAKEFNKAISQIENGDFEVVEYED